MISHDASFRAGLNGRNGLNGSASYSTGSPTCSSYSTASSTRSKRLLHSFDSLKCLPLAMLCVMSAGLKLLHMLMLIEIILKLFVFIVRRSGSQMPIHMLLNI